MHVVIVCQNTCSNYHWKIAMSSNYQTILHNCQIHSNYVAGKMRQLHSIMRQLHSIMRQLHSIMRQLHSKMRKLHSIKRQLHSIMRQLHSISRQLHSITDNYIQ